MNALAPMNDFRPAYWQIEPMERKFVDGYVKDIELVAEQTGQRLLAVLQAPFPIELDQRAKNMLARPLVRAAIADRVNELSRLYDISTYRTLKELVGIAYSTMGNYTRVDSFGYLDIDLSNTTPEQMAAVKSFEIDDHPRGGRKVKIVLHDKMAALDKVMRYQGLLGDDAVHFREAVQSEKPVKTIPADADDDTAADAYSRLING